MSTEKKELDKIIAQMNIQVDNPVCILHQDVARSFLNSSDPKSLYKFFMKASRFDDIAKLYAESSTKVHTIKGNIDRKFEVFTVCEYIYRQFIEIVRLVKLTTSSQTVITLAYIF